MSIVWYVTVKAYLKAAELGRSVKMVSQENAEFASLQNLIVIMTKL